MSKTPVSEGYGGEGLANQPPRPGEILRDLRDAQGLDLADVAERSDIRVEHLRSLERCDGADLRDPSLAPALSYVYALSLGVSSEKAERLSQAVRESPARGPRKKRDGEDERGAVWEFLDRRAWAILAGITLIGLLLRLPWFGNSLFGDELSTYVVVNGNDIGRMFDLIHSDQEVTPPLYFLAASLSQFLGDSSEWLRLPALLAGIAAIPITFLLGRRIADRPTGLIAAAVMALSPFLTFYAAEARAYTFSLLFCALAALMLLRAIERRESRAWAAFALSAAAAMYSHYTSVFLLIALAGWTLAFHPPARLALITAGTGAFLLFVPWLPQYVADAESPGADLIGILAPFSWETFGAQTTQMLVGTPLIPVRDLPGRLTAAVVLVTILVGTVAAIARAVRSGRSKVNPGLVLVAVLALAPILGGAFYSLVSVDTYVSRNLITAIPGVALLIGVVAVRLRGPWQSVWLATVLAGFAVGAVMSLDPDNQRADYGSAADYLLDVAGPEDPIVDTRGLLLGPGVRTTLEIELEDRDATEQPVVRLGYPTLEDAAALRAPGGPGQFFPIEIPPGGESAREVLDLADGGRFFLVIGGNLSFDELTAFATEGPLHEFLAEVPSAYVSQSEKSFPGGDGGIIVYELSRAP